MKSFILFLLFLIALAAAFFFFLVRLDPERLKPELERELSLALGAEVETGGIRFLSRLRQEVEVQGILIRPRSGGTPFLEAPSAVFKIQPGPLLRKELVLMLITLKDAQIFFSRQRGGWNKESDQPPIVSGAFRQRPVKSPAADASSPGYFWKPGPWKVKINAVEVRNAELRLSDTTTDRPFEILIHTIDALLTVTETETLYRLQMQGEASGLPDPDIIFQGVLDTGKKVLLLTGSAGEQDWMFEGALDLSGALVQTQGELDIFQYALETELLEASLTAEIQGIVEGANPKEWFSSLAAKGAVDLRGGVFKPANLVHAALRLSLEVLDEKGPRANLAEAGLKSLSAEGSLYDLAQADIEIFHERLFLRKGLLKHEDYLMELDGSYDMTRREADFKAKLVFLEKASAALAEQFPLLRVLLNPHGRLVIPFRYSGLLPNGVLKPDADYLRMRGSAGASDAA